MKQFGIIVAVVVLLLAYSSVFVVQEGQRGIVVQFGKLKRGSNDEPQVYSPGLHFKVPFIDSVRKLDARIQTMDGRPDRFFTSEKKDLIIDSYVKWRISDFGQFLLSTGGSVTQAESLLKRKINNGLRSEIGGRTINQIVSGERSAIMEEALKRSARSSEIGVTVLDVRIKQINLPSEVSTSIYKRMRAERHAVATEHRSQGREQAEIIRANVDRTVSVMLANADRESRTIRGEGDAQAAKIYAQAYTQAPKFFEFWRSLNAYRNSFKSGNDIMVIQPDSQFFDVMKKGPDAIK
ncbi:protease modulator HflC [Celerinatantimonas sp. YJH-8]|uniref:protease modulator HflC n=1 Tax=Celerinatantimonas sp. YJH-8 TaxID=3228714 RepID=UPI0038C8FD90